MRASISPSVSFPSGFPTTTTWAFFFRSMRTTCHASHNLVILREIEVCSSRTEYCLQNCDVSLPAVSCQCVAQIFLTVPFKFLMVAREAELFLAPFVAVLHWYMPKTIFRKCIITACLFRNFYWNVCTLFGRCGENIKLVVVFSLISN
jgi:hypothetical protein